MELPTAKYTAIKPKGFPYWLWFQTDKVTRESYTFTGTGGWGRGGANTNISIPESSIEAEMTSSDLQYT